MSAALEREVLRDYGVTADASGARVFLRLVRPLRDITSAGQYVAACRAISRNREYLLPSGSYAPLEGEGRIDGRLIAAGWNRESPTRWIREGGLQNFLAYWERAAERPGVVGSSCNELTPEMAYDAMRMGIPAAIAGRIGWRAFGRPFGRTDKAPRRVPRRRVVSLVRMARALRRRGHDGLDSWSSKALEALGRLCPELQRVAISTVDASQFDGARPVRVRDIDWARVSEVQHQMREDTSGRVRVAWATGRRQRDLFDGVAGPPAEWQLASTGLHMSTRPAIGDRWVVRQDCCGACSRCTREVTEVETISVSPYGETLKVLWSWLPGPDGQRRLYDVAHDAYVPTGRPARPTLAAFLAPSYPRVPVEIATRIARGDDVGDSILTAKERHDWLMLGAPGTPLDYLRSQLPSGVPPLRDSAVVRWVMALTRRGQFDALMREREARGPHGETVRFRFLDRLDEVATVDLDRGPATGVGRAFERAAERFGEHWLSENRANYRLLHSPPPWRLYRRAMRYLLTPADLIAEGEQLGHCCGGYAPFVAEGRSVVIAINVLGQRSTLELDSRGRVLQHRGPKNGSPPPLCERIAERFLCRI